MTPLEECVQTFRKWLHLPDVGTLYITLAAVVANLTTGDPVWLLIVGPPGGGKTETLNPLPALEYVHPTATLTVAALLSGTPKKEVENGSKGGLLRVIGDFGIIVLKDFTSVLSMHREARAEILAALREIYDGEWTRHVGTGGGRTLHWSGKVGLIAGCTGTIDSHHAVMGSMGERFILYRLPPIDGDHQAAVALDHVGEEATMRAELSAAVGKVLGSVDVAGPRAALSAEDKDRLNRLANVATRCRSAVERDSYSREIELIPEPEAPARFARVLLLLRNGLLAIGVDDVTVWQVLTKAALDSMPAIRRQALDVIVDGPWRPGADYPHDHHPGTGNIARAAGYPERTMLRALEDLEVHGVLKKWRQASNYPWQWSLTDWTRERWPRPPETSEGSFIETQDSEEDFSGERPEKAA